MIRAKVATDPMIALPPNSRAPNIAAAVPGYFPKGSKAPLAPEPVVNAQPNVAKRLGPKNPHRLRPLIRYIAINNRLEQKISNVP